MLCCWELDIKINWLMYQKGSFAFIFVFFHRGAVDRSLFSITVLYTSSLFISMYHYYYEKKKFLSYLNVVCKTDFWLLIWYLGDANTPLADTDVLRSGDQHCGCGKNQRVHRNSTGGTVGRTQHQATSGKDQWRMVHKPLYLKLTFIENCWAKIITKYICIINHFSSEWSAVCLL